MKLIKQHKIVEDNWMRLADDAPLADGSIIVSYGRWQQDKDQILGRSNGEVGIALCAEDDVTSLAEELDKISLITLHFEKFNDGRSFSQTRWLKEKFGFKGELRASGAYIQDQILPLIKVGIDSFEVPDEFSLEAFQAAIREVSVQYQTSTIEPSPLFRRRQLSVN